MRQCPKCGKWSLDFDGYFGRFRCLDSECTWMPPSTAERKMRLWQRHEEPTRLAPLEFRELGLTLTPFYDKEADVLSVDFGLDEPTFDLPESDAQMIWQIGRESDQVAGFAIVGVKEGAISKITIQFIVSRKEDIERRLQRSSSFLSRGRATRALIEEVIVTAVSDLKPVLTESPRAESAWQDVGKQAQQLAGV